MNMALEFGLRLAGGVWLGIRPPIGGTAYGGPGWFRWLTLGLVGEIMLGPRGPDTWKEISSCLN